jgi:hypothetical protein
MIRLPIHAPSHALIAAAVFSGLLYAGPLRAQDEEVDVICKGAESRSMRRHRRRATSSSSLTSIA